MGDSRSCSRCAVAIALNRTLPLLGFRDCFVELAPYAAWMEARGLELFQRWNEPIARLAVKHFPDQLIEWTMDFDEWASFRDEHNYSLKSWREEYGRDADRPFNPLPTTFLFNFGKLSPIEKPV